MKTPHVIRAANGRELGTVVARGDGFRFIPFVTGRKPSTKTHATPEEAIPSWVSREEQK